MHLDIRDRREGLLAVGVLGGEGEEGCDPQGDTGRHRLGAQESRWDGEQVMRWTGEKVRQVSRLTGEQVER